MSLYCVIKFVTLWTVTADLSYARCHTLWIGKSNASVYTHSVTSEAYNRLCITRIQGSGHRTHTPTGAETRPYFIAV